MNMKKVIILLLVVALTFAFSSCSEEVEPEVVKPQISRMKSICELAVMDCYYHNVAKFKEEDAEGFLLWKKDKNFWIEYSGVVKVGIDTSKLNIVVEEDKVTISIPEAKVLGEKVDPESLTTGSFLVDKDSAKISGEDEIAAFDEAQKRMVEAASADTALLASAQQRAQKLLEEYVLNIGNAVGVDYSIEWVYMDSEGSASAQPSEESTESDDKAGE